MAEPSDIPLPVLQYIQGVRDNFNYRGDPEGRMELIRYVSSMYFNLTFEHRQLYHTISTVSRS